MKVKSKNYLTPEQRANRRFQADLFRYFLWISIVFSIIYLAAIYRPHN